MARTVAGLALRGIEPRRSAAARARRAARRLGARGGGATRRLPHPALRHAACRRRRRRAARHLGPTWRRHPGRGRGSGRGCGCGCGRGCGCGCGAQARRLVSAAALPPRPSRIGARPQSRRRSGAVPRACSCAVLAAMRRPGGSAPSWRREGPTRGSRRPSRLRMAAPWALEAMPRRACTPKRGPRPHARLHNAVERRAKSPAAPPLDSLCQVPRSNGTDRRVHGARRPA